MAKTSIFMGSGLNSFGPNFTGYYAPAVYSGNPNTTESNAQITFRTAGTASGLFLQVTANSLTAASTYTFRIGAINQNQVVSITASTSGLFQDVTHTDSVSVGNVVSMKLITGATGTSMSLSGWGYLFDPGANALMHFAVIGSSTFSAASTSLFFGLASTEGTSAPFTTEANMQWKVRQSFTFKNLFTLVTLNTRTTATTIATRKNGVNQNVTVSIAGGSTGTFEDTTHTDTASSGELWNFVLTTGTGTGNFGVLTIAIEMVSSANYMHFIAGPAGTVTNHGVTTYFTPAGEAFPSTTQGLSKVSIGVACTASRFECFVSANTVTAASTVTMQKNLSNINETFSISASTTGWFEDVTNTDSLIAGDAVEYKLVAGSTGTSLTIQSIGFLALLPSSFTWQQLDQGNEPLPEDWGIASY